MHSALIAFFSSSDKYFLSTKITQITWSTKYYLLGIFTSSSLPRWHQGIRIGKKIIYVLILFDYKIYLGLLSWWWTGKPGMLQSMGLQRVEHDWATELLLSFIKWLHTWKQCHCLRTKARSDRQAQLQSCHCLVSKLCLTFKKSWIVHSPWSSYVHEISQARILKWVAISFSSGASWSRDRSHVSCLAGRLSTTESPMKPPMQS